MANSSTWEGSSIDSWTHILKCDYTTGNVDENRAPQLNTSNISSSTMGKLTSPDPYIDHPVNAGLVERGEIAECYKDANQPSSDASENTGSFSGTPLVKAQEPPSSATVSLHNAGKKFTLAASSRCSTPSVHSTGDGMNSSFVWVRGEEQLTITCVGGWTTESACLAGSSAAQYPSCLNDEDWSL